jgi:acyl-CoA reductase-like NAD-dependent aldehyde dehydrogenase
VTPPSGIIAGTPVGSWKNSGPGREECLHELLDYTQKKAIYVFV